MAESRLLGCAEGQRHDRRQARQRQNVGGVVMENRNQLERLALPQKIEVIIRDHLARQVAVPFDTEYLVFQIYQAAAFQAQLPKTARSEKQVQVFHPLEWMAAARHTKTGLEQRLVVGFAVVGDQHVE